MLDAVASYIVKEWQVIAQAPAVFTLSMTTSGAVVWIAARLYYAGRIESLDHRLKLKDDQLADYRNKLSGASPDEAKARLDALENQVRALSPRRLTADQREQLRSRLAQGTGAVHVVEDMACPDVRKYAGDFAWAFEAAGWLASKSMVMGPGYHPPSGLGVLVPDPNNLTPAQTSVVNALRAAGADFDLHAQRPVWRPGDSEPDAELLFTSKLT
jgi:hypothetical protein